MTFRGRTFLLFVALFVGVMLCSFAAADDTEESITAWKRWKNIDAAITLRPLDGPSDIIEKVEIIEDRIDELVSEKVRLEKELQVNLQKLQTLRNQKEVLNDMAEIQQGGDFQTRQRLLDLTERIRLEENMMKQRKESIAELEKEITRLQNLAAEYHEKAMLLRLKEGGVQ